MKITLQKSARRGKAFFGSLAAEAGILAVFTATDSSHIATTAQALKLFSEVCGGLAELAKEVAEDKKQAGDPEIRIRELLKFLALESYLSAFHAKLQDFPAPFKNQVGRRLKHSPENLPECDVTRGKGATDAIIPVFNALDSQLLNLLLVDAGSAERCQRFVQETRKAAENKVPFFLVEERYQSLGVFFDRAYFHKNLGELSTSKQTPTDVAEIIVEAPPSANAPKFRLRPTAPEPPRIGAVTTGAPQLDDRFRPIFERRFATGKAEVDTGSCERGERIFADLVSELDQLDEPALGDLLARSLYNQGVALSNLRRESEAVDLFKRGASILGGRQRVPLSSYFAAYCGREFEKARAELQRVREKGSVESAILNLHEAECFLREGKPAEALAAAAHVSSPAGATTRAFALVGLTKYSDALNELKEAERQWPLDIQLELATAHAQARPLLDRYYEQRAARNVVPEGDVPPLKTALGLFEKVRIRANSSGLKNFLYESLSWSALISLALGQPENALKFIDEGLLEWPRDVPLLANRQVALVRIGNLSGAADAAAKLRDVPGFGTESLVLEISARLGLGENDKASDLLGLLLTYEPDAPSSDFRVASHVFHLALAPRAELTAARVAKDISEGANSDPMCVAVTADYLDKKGDAAGCDGLLKRASGSASGDKAVFVRGVAGRIFIRRGAWADALRIFGEDGIDPIDSIFSEQIILCLYQLEDLYGVTQLGKKLEERGLLTALNRRVLVGAYMKLQNTPEAERHAAPIVASTEATPIDFTNLFFVRRSSKPIAQALEVLEQGRKKFPEDPFLKALLAQAYLSCDRYKDSLAEARRLSVIAPGSDFERDAWSMYAVSRLPATLLNAAEQDMVAQCVAKHPAFTAISLAGPDGRIEGSQFHQELRERSERSAKVISDGRKNRLPVSVMASLLGQSVFELWWRMTMQTSGFVWMAAGDAEELTREQAACDGAKKIVADYSILCTLAALERLDLLGQLFEEIVIPSSTRQVFLSEFELSKLSAPSSGSAHYQEGQLIFIETDSNEEAMRRRIMTDVIDLFDHANVRNGAPTPEEWTANKEVLESRAFKGGVAFAFLTAKSLALPFASDEFRVRQLANQQHHLPTFCSNNIVTRAHQEGFITDAERQELLRKLLEMNYSFVSTPLGFLRKYLLRTKFVADKVTIRLSHEVVATTWGSVTGTLELGRLTADLWLHRNDPGVWPQSEWIPIIRGQLNRAPKQELRHFALGVALELPLFPSVAKSCLKGVFETDQVAHDRALLIVQEFRNYASMMATEEQFGPAANKAWSDVYRDGI